MIIYTPAMRMDKWFLFIYYKEVGKPQLVRVGKRVMKFGRGQGFAGQYGAVRLEMNKDPFSVELFEGACVLAVVCSPEPTADQQFVANLSSRDEVELVKPSSVMIIDPALARDVIGKGNDSALRSLEVLEGKRKTFYS